MDLRLSRVGVFAWVLFRYIVVAASCTSYGVCLTKDAYITPGIMYEGVTELVHNPALEHVVFGWIAVGWTAAVFIAVGTPLLIVYMILKAVAEKLNAVDQYMRFQLRVIRALFALIVVTTLLITRALAIGSWLANPMIALSWVFLLSGRSRWAFWSALGALVLILSFLTLGEVPAGLKLADVPIVSYGLGYWLWMASAAVMVLGVGGELAARYGLGNRADNPDEQPLCRE
jgi:hypothetical protein